jgi:AraC-like DNA-binding protein
MTRHRTTQQDINSAERAKQALQLRKMGFTLDEIATQCGYQDKSGAFRAIKRELANIPAEAAEELRTLELARLDHLYSVCYKRMLDKNTKDPLWAVDRLLAISESRRKLLNLDVKPDELPANTVVIREIAPGYLGSPVEAKSE